MKLFTSLFLVLIVVLAAGVKEADTNSANDMIYQTKEVRVGMQKRRYHKWYRLSCFKEVFPVFEKSQNRKHLQNRGG
ncbi:hypothetical protein [Bacillus pumilus]|uniref:hypothetical protein n=1 Tax=Bacillus pumilus TaxID=1408 RepID=UPI00316AD3D3